MAQNNFDNALANFLEKSSPKLIAELTAHVRSIARCKKHQLDKSSHVNDFLRWANNLQGLGTHHLQVATAIYLTGIAGRVTNHTRSLLNSKALELWQRSFPRLSDDDQQTVRNILFKAPHKHIRESWLVTSAENCVAAKPTNRTRVIDTKVVATFWYLKRDY